jgi:hypothetical protein
MRLVSIVMPPKRGTAPPHTPEPPPYGTIGTPRLRASLHDRGDLAHGLGPHHRGRQHRCGATPARRASSRRGHMSRA